MKSLIKLLSILLALTLCLTACEGGLGEETNSGNNENQGGNNNANSGEGEESGNDESYFKTTLIKFNSELKFGKAVFDADEEIKVNLEFVQNFHGHYTEYFDIYLVNETEEKIHFLRRVNEPAIGDNYTPWKGEITIPSEYLSGESGTASIRTYVPFLIEDFNTALANGPVAPDYAFVKEGGTRSDFSYEVKDGKITVSNIKNGLPPVSLSSLPTDLVSTAHHSILASLSADSGYFNINENGYDKENIELDFYFGRRFFGSADEYRKNAEDIGKASIYISDADGENILITETKQNYISDAYRVEWILDYNYESLYACAKYNEASLTKIFIPSEVIAGDSGILFLFVFGADAELIKIPISYTVKDDKVYLTREYAICGEYYSALDLRPIDMPMRAPLW